MNGEIPQDAVHPEVDQGVCSKIFSIIGTILSNVPPWGWLLFVILLILFFEWLKKFLSSKNPRVKRADKNQTKGRVVTDLDFKTGTTDPSLLSTEI